MQVLAPLLTDQLLSLLNIATVMWLGDGPSCHADVLEWRNEAMDQLYTLIQRRAAGMPTPVVAARPTIRSQSTSDLDLVVMQLESAEATQFMGYVRNVISYQRALGVWDGGVLEFGAVVL